MHRNTKRVTLHDGAMAVIHWLLPTTDVSTQLAKRLRRMHERQETQGVRCVAACAKLAKQTRAFQGIEANLQQNVSRSTWDERSVHVDDCRFQGLRLTRMRRNITSLPECRWDPAAGARIPVLACGGGDGVVSGCSLECDPTRCSAGEIFQV
jgi:hypothetical protein